MRKIISILVAVGLVLSMVAMTAPVGAQFGATGTDWAVVGVTVFDSNCEGELGTYNITFTIPASLTEGLHTITVKFPAGTVYPAAWKTGNIRIWDGADWTDVFASEITRDGDEVTFLSPIHYAATSSLVVQFKSMTPAPLTGIKNPPAGKYNLEVKTSRAPMSTYVKSGWNGAAYATYTIVPAVATYKWALDFSPTYPGIAADFVPPFKACGQNGTDEPFETYYDGVFDRWVTNFTTNLLASPAGCYSCPNMEAYITMTARPTTTARAHLYEDDVLAHNFTSTSPLSTGSWYALDDWDPLPFDANEQWVLGLHFDTPGTYTLNFELLYGGTGVCELGCTDIIRSVDFVVHQWKDAFPITLDAKWNLISLPIVPFDTSIASILAPLPYPGLLLSVWHYDRCANSWATYGNGQTSLTDIEDGKAYWFRMRYGAELAPASLTGPAPIYPKTLWIFGLKAPKAPSSPSAYPVCPGWNMVGFRSTVDMDEGDYLWSVSGIYNPDAIYGWTAGATQDWFVLADAPVAYELQVGLGYWVPFIDYGEIYPPLP